MNEMPPNNYEDGDMIWMEIRINRMEYEMQLRLMACLSVPHSGHPFVEQETVQQQNHWLQVAAMDRENVFGLEKVKNAPE